MKKIAFLLAVLFLFRANAYAANGDLVVNGNLTVGGTISAPTLSVPQVMTQVYRSLEQPITVGGSLQLAHGLTGVTDPALIQISVYIICKTAELGYLVGDIVAVPYYQTDLSYGDVVAYGWYTRAKGASIVLTSSTINIKYSGSTGGYVWAIINKSTGLAGNIDENKWKAIFVARY